MRTSLLALAAVLAFSLHLGQAQACDGKAQAGHPCGCAGMAKNKANEKDKDKAAAAAPSCGCKAGMCPQAPKADTHHGA